jgi:hypothetical protein
MSPVSNNIRSSSEVNNNIICEALGCYSKANNKIAVEVGSKGTIFLCLCDNCKPKFYSASHQDIKESKMEATSD